MDFSSLSPFVTPSSLSSSGSSIATPSSFVAPVPPSPFSTQSLGYLPSPFAPPSSSSAPAPVLCPPPQLCPCPCLSSQHPFSGGRKLQTCPPLSRPSLQVPRPLRFPRPDAPIPFSRTHNRTRSASTSSPRLPPPHPRRTSTRVETSPRSHIPAEALTTRSPTTNNNIITHPPALTSLSSLRPPKTFDIPTAPGPSTVAGVGAQTATLLTYDSFWSSHASAAGGWRRALGSAAGVAPPAVRCLCRGEQHRGGHTGSLRGWRRRTRARREQRQGVSEYGPMFCVAHLASTDRTADTICCVLSPIPSRLLQLLFYMPMLSSLLSQNKNLVIREQRMARYLGLFDDRGKAIGDDVELFRAVHTHTYEATQLRNLRVSSPAPR
ncbi:hypothetical protein BC826DRAFT_557694 [Russula brevipes]|nr:hypothetical protein BC826DRAFT_557694 [Russula brevipes]